MDQTRFLVEQLADWAQELGAGRITLRFPRPRQEILKTDLGHFHLRSELFLQIGGSTEFRFPAETLVLGPGEALLIPPRVSHAERVLEGGGSGRASEAFVNIVLIVHGSTLYAHVAGADRHHHPFVRYPDHRHHEDCLRLGAWMEDAADCGGLEGVSRNLVAAALSRSAQLLAEERPATGHEPRLVLMARGQVRNRLSDPLLSVASVASAIGCSADYLSHLFHQTTGLKLAEWINELRLGQAAELLTTTALSSKETGWACGFSNQSYFIRLFRRRYGASPMEYRPGANR